MTALAPVGAADSMDTGLGSLFDLLPIGAYRSLPDGRQLRANAALVRLNGYDSEAQLLAAVHDIAREWYVDPTRRETFRRLLETEGRVTGFVSEVWRHRTRERIWIREHAHVVRGADGAVRYYEGTVEEISDQVVAQQALSESEERLRLALDAVGDGLWDVDLRTGKEVFSERLLRMYGFEDGALTGGGALDARTHPDDLPGMLADRQAHAEGRAPLYANEHRVRHRDGRWIWVLTRGMVIARDDAGRPLRMIGTHTDITERRHAEDAHRQRDQAEAADRAKTLLLSRISHELRTPLNAVLGLAQLMEMDGNASEQHAAWNRQILASGRHLLALVEDMLDLSVLQSGQLSLAPQAVRLAPLLCEAWSMVAPLAGHAQVVLADSPESAGEARVHADPMRLKQVLINLLSNAIKYNRPGGRVGMAVRAGADRVSIAISDTGWGLSGEQLARVFQPFERLGADRTAVGGAGLGLALSKQLVEAMGGRIAVTSEAGLGSCFTVELPAAVSSP